MRPDFYVTTALMGYGHLRAADNVAQVGRGRLVRVDLPPFVRPAERWLWTASQSTYHGVSRTVETRFRILLRILEKIEDIPEDSRRASMLYSDFVRAIMRLGFGRTLCESPLLDGAPLLHSFFLPALACAYHRHPGKNYLLLCDTDFHRVWTPMRPSDDNLTYLVPTASGADRLMSYGVTHGRIAVTGFPLPLANTGGRDLAALKADAQARLARLAPGSDSPLRLVFAISGAGCYLGLLETLIAELLPALRAGRVRLAVAAGNNRVAKASVEGWLAAAGAREGEGVRILYAPDPLESFGLFNRALRECDLLITKPGELVFYAALGIPQIHLPPIGKHEVKNRAWLRERGGALDFPGPQGFGEWLEARRSDGRWQRAADSAFTRLPKSGAFEVSDIVRDRL